MVDVAFPGAHLQLAEAAALAQWDVLVAARSQVSVTWSLAVRDPDAVVIPASSSGSGPAVRIDADDRRLSPFVARRSGDCRQRSWLSSTTPCGSISDSDLLSR